MRIREFRGPKRSPALGLSAVVVPILLFLACMLLWRSFFPSLSQYWMLAAWVALFVVFGRWVNGRSAVGFQRENERVVQTAVGLGICPSCGYDLLGLELAADGCVECPECNAAWRATRIVRTSPLILRDATAAELDVYKRVGAEGLFAFAASMWWDRDDRGRRTPSAAANLRDRIAAEANSAVRVRLVRGGTIRSWPGFRRRMLSEGLCPSCAWDLRELAAHDDGRVECPVCTSAWIAADIAPA